MGLVLFSGQKDLSDPWTVHYPDHHFNIGLVFRPPFRYQSSIQTTIQITNNHLNTWLIQILHLRYSEVHFSDPCCYETAVLARPWSSKPQYNAENWLTKRMSQRDFFKDGMPPHFEAPNINKVYDVGVRNYLYFAQVTILYSCQQFLQFFFLWGPSPSLPSSGYDSCGWTVDTVTRHTHLAQALRGSSWAGIGLRNKLRVGTSIP